MTLSRILIFEMRSIDSAEIPALVRFIKKLLLFAVGKLKPTHPEYSGRAQDSTIERKSLRRESPDSVEDIGFVNAGLWFAPGKNLPARVGKVLLDHQIDQQVPNSAPPVGFIGFLNN